MTDRATPDSPPVATNGAVLRGPCSRCGYVWYGRPRYPRGCARCHSAYWDTPAERRHGRIAGDPPNPNWTTTGHKPPALAPKEDSYQVEGKKRLMVGATNPTPSLPIPAPKPVTVAPQARQDRMGDAPLSLEPFAFGPPPEYVPPRAPEATWLTQQEEPPKAKKWAVEEPSEWPIDPVIPEPEPVPAEPELPVPTTAQLLALDPPRRIPAHGPVAISVEEFDIEMPEGTGR